METFKIIILSETKGELKYNALLLKKNITKSSNYELNIIKEFSESKNKLLDKEFKFDLEKNKDMKFLFFLIKKNLNLNWIKFDLFFTEIVPFSIAESEILKFEKL